MKEELQQVDIDVLVESKTNTRKTFDKAAMAELTASIKEKGILVPLLVRPIGGRSEIVCGARRYRAAVALGFDQVPAIIRELSDEDAWAIGVVDNLQREGVHPLDEAAGYRDLMKRSGLTVEGIVAKVGKSRSYVAQRVKLNDLSPDCLKAYRAGQIELGHALLLARLDEAQQKSALQVCSDFDDKPRPLSSLSDHIERTFMLDLQKAHFPKDDPTLVPKAGSCMTCPRRTGFNQDLFNDLAKQDTCMNPPCFKKKEAAFLTRARKGIAEATGKIPIEVSNETGWSRRGLPTKDKWEAAKTGDKDAVPAIIIEGAGIGRTLMVKIAKSAVKAEASPEKRAATEQKQKAEAEIEGRMERAIAEATAKVIPDNLTKVADLQLLFTEYMHSYADPGVLKLLGIGKFDRKNPKPTHLVKLMLWEAFDQSYDTDKVAARWGVDVKGIEKRIRAEAKTPKAPEKKAVKKSKPTKKGKK